MNVDKADIALPSFQAADVGPVQFAVVCQFLLRKASLLAKRAHPRPELLLNYLGSIGRHRINRNSHGDNESTDFTSHSVKGSENVKSGQAGGPPLDQPTTRVPKVRSWNLFGGTAPIRLDVTRNGRPRTQVRQTSRSSIITRRIPLPPIAIHPGEHLAEELKELGISASGFARKLGVPANRITAILNGQRSITADTALRLASFFGASPNFWLNLQVLYDLCIAEQKLNPANPPPTLVA